MRKHLHSMLVVLAIIAVLSSFTSCKEEIAVPTEGTIIVNIAGDGSRGILPAISMVAANYSITLTDSSGNNAATATISADKNSTSFRIPAGTYTVSVDAKNTDGTVIGKGTESLSVVAGATNSVTVSIVECQGNGTFAVSIQANSGYSLTLKLFNSANEEQYSGALAYNDGAFTTNGTVSLQNGFYRFQIIRSDTNETIKNDTVRLVKGVTSTYSASFAFASDGSLSIINEMVNIPSISISLNKETLNIAETLEAEAEVSGISDYASCWFVDGEAVGSYGDYADLSLELTNLEAGTHEVALFVKNSQVLWSESASFTVENPTMSLVFPSFENEEYGSGSRGLTNATLGNQEFFSGNPRLGAGILLTTPLVPSLKSVSGINVSLGILPPSVTVDFVVYGLTIRYVDHLFTPTGIYVRYNIMDNSEIVGDIDYYYDWVENAFSLREKSILNLPGNIFGTLVLEMRDISVEKTPAGVLTGNFKCGQYNSETSELDRNAWVEQIQLYDPNDDECSGGYHYMKCFITLNSSDGVLSSILHPWEMEQYAKKESSDIASLLPDGYDCFDDFIIDNQENHFDTIMEFMDHDYMYEVLNHFYTEESLLQGNERAGFRNTSHALELKPEYSENVIVGGAHVGPSIYTTSSRNKFNLDAKVGASILMASGLEILMHMEQDLADAKNQYDNLMNFKTFYGSVENCSSRQEIAAFILDKQLRQCGITNENFIANFIAEEIRQDVNHTWRYKVPVTGIDQASFGALLDAAYN